MGLLDKWILKRAKKIAEAKERERISLSIKYEDQKKIKEKAFDIITDLIKQEIVNYEKKPCHIKVGDRAIVNKYSLTRDGHNGWDGGPRMYLDYLKDVKGPVVVKITEVYVDTSLAYEKIDRFIGNHTFDALNRMISSGTLVYNYHRYLTTNKGRSDLFDVYGLYRTALFDFDNEFQPKWGLNVDSFLPEGTEEFDLTYSVWESEIQLNIERSNLDEKLKVLEAERKELYSGIYSFIKS